MGRGGAVLEGRRDDAGEGAVVAGVSDAPDYGLSGPFDEATLIDGLGTATPSRKVFIEKFHALYEHLDRGQCGHVVLFTRGKPSHVAFLGMTFDEWSYEASQAFDELE